MRRAVVEVESRLIDVLTYEASSLLVRARRFGSRDEFAAHRILQKTFADTTWIVYKDQALSRVLVKDEHLSDAEFSLYTRGSFDFVVWSAPTLDDAPATPIVQEDYDVEFVLELDGFGHDEPKQVVLDLMKNDFCHRAGMPLLRIGSDHVREGEETSVLEWLMHAYIATAREMEDDVLNEDSEGDILGDDLEEDIASDEEIEGDLVLGEPGIEMEHPFPDNALVARRLMERYAIGIGTVKEFLLAPEGARYVAEIPWPGRQPPRMRQGRASEFVISERDFVVVARERPDIELSSGVGRAEFAAFTKLPNGKTVNTEFPWDPSGVAMELAEFDALKQIESWATRTLGPH